ncbi:MAG: endolytic transglycosylase MltG [Ignavibacteriae bacterium]|nr:endolytic transglycosylase MltG [Ignavibacteriota bacterium]
MRRYRIVLVLAGATLLVAAVVLYRILYGPNTFVDGDQKPFYLSRGQTFASVVDSLEARGIIRSRSLFVFVARIHGGTPRLIAGKYIFKSGVSNIEIFRDMRDGRGIVPIFVTIPEGLRARAQARILSRTIGIDSARFVTLISDPDFIESLGIQAQSLEGYLLPETYSFFWQADEQDVIRRFVEQFKEFYHDSLDQWARDFGWTTNQVLTLASIVEGEAVLDEERATIAGVYHNRLRKGMRLEADPTIQYMIDDGPRRIRYSDLKQNNPYNTYVNKGLPPGPVNNPGRASILAALQPERHNYLFFVANGKGGHWFTSNYNDHMRYVRMYRRLRSNAESQASRDAEGIGKASSPR